MKGKKLEGVVLEKMRRLGLEIDHYADIRSFAELCGLLCVRYIALQHVPKEDARYS